MKLTPGQRDRLLQERIDLQLELDDLLEQAEEDDLAGDRADSLRLEIARLERVLDPDLAHRQQEQGRSEQD